MTIVGVAKFLRCEKTLVKNPSGAALINLCWETMYFFLFKKNQEVFVLDLSI